MEDKENLLSPENESQDHENHPNTNPAPTTQPDASPVEKPAVQPITQSCIDPQLAQPIAQPIDVVQPIVQPIFQTPQIQSGTPISASCGNLKKKFLCLIISIWVMFFLVIINGVYHYMNINNNKVIILLGTIFRCIGLLGVAIQVISSANNCDENKLNSALYLYDFFFGIITAVLIISIVVDFIEKSVTKFTMINFAELALGLILLGALLFHKQFFNSLKIPSNIQPIIPQ